MQRGQKEDFFDGIQKIEAQQGMPLSGHWPDSKKRLEIDLFRFQAWRALGVVFVGACNGLRLVLDTGALMILRILNPPHAGAQAESRSGAPFDRFRSGL
jgi:hypothetical protein